MIVNLLHLIILTELLSCWISLSEHGDPEMLKSPAEMQNNNNKNSE